tara:strand:+ start:856 stop:2883 length:2028 start_codon:yes stop_codon:yes gene_type:complete
MDYYQKYLKYKEKYNYLLIQQGGAASPEQLEYRYFLNQILETEIDDDCFANMQRLFRNWKRGIRDKKDYQEFYKRKCKNQETEIVKQQKMKKILAEQEKQRLIKEFKEKEEVAAIQAAEKRKRQKEQKIELRRREEIELRKLEAERQRRIIQEAQRKKLAGGEGIIFAHGSTVNNRLCIIPHNLTLRPTVKCFFPSPRENYMKSQLLIDTFKELLSYIDTYTKPEFIASLEINELNEDEQKAYSILEEAIRDSEEEEILSMYLRKYNSSLKNLPEIDQEIEVINMQILETFGKPLSEMVQEELIQVLNVYPNISELPNLIKTKNEKELFIKIFNHIFKKPHYLTRMLNEADKLERKIRNQFEEESFITQLLKRQTREKIPKFTYGEELERTYENVYESGSIIPDMKLTFNPTYPVMDGKGAYSFTGIVTSDLELPDDRLIVSFTDPGRRIEEDVELQETIKRESLKFHDERIIEKEKIYMGPPTKANIDGRNFFYLSEILKKISDYKESVMDIRSEEERLSDPFPSTFILQACRGSEIPDAPNLSLEDCLGEEISFSPSINNPIERVGSFSEAKDPLIVDFNKKVDSFFGAGRHAVLSTNNEIKIVTYIQRKSPIPLGEIMPKIEVFIREKLTQIKNNIDRENYISNENFCFFASIFRDDISDNLIKKIIAEILK